MLILFYRYFNRWSKKIKHQKYINIYEVRHTVLTFLYLSFNKYSCSLNLYKFARVKLLSGIYFKPGVSSIIYPEDNSAFPQLERN